MKILKRNYHFQAFINWALENSIKWQFKLSPDMDADSMGHFVQNFTSDIGREMGR